MNLVIKVFSFCTIFLFLAGGSAPAKTPDGSTPAEETVCDELRDATSGLYGLCVAFCEAQDCEVDWSSDDPFGNCSTSARNLYDNYERKRRSGDPEMPCAVQPVVTTGGGGGGCPCFSSADLSSALSNPYGLCLIDFGLTSTTMIGDEMASASTRFNDPYYTCYYNNLATGVTQLVIDENESLGCRDLLVDMINSGVCNMLLP